VGPHGIDSSPGYPTHVVKRRLRLGGLRDAYRVPHDYCCVRSYRVTCCFGQNETHQVPSEVAPGRAALAPVRLPANVRRIANFSRKLFQPSPELFHLLPDLIEATSGRVAATRRQWKCCSELDKTTENDSKDPPPCWWQEGPSPTETVVRPSLPNDFCGFIIARFVKAEQQACSHSLLNFPSCQRIR
jgi:hypothetical protein